MTEKEGILYIATGERYISQAEKSARSIKEVSPEYPITIVSGIEQVPDIFDQSKFIKESNNSSLDKVENILRTDYEKTIFLDVDTYVATDDAIPSIFDVLDRFDIAVASDPYNRGSQFCNGSDRLSTAPIPHGLKWFNTGVLGFNLNEMVEKSFSYWEEIYKKYDGGNQLSFDQIPFHKMIYETDIRYGLLPPEYNFVLKAPQPITEEIRILHTIEDIDNCEELVNRINDEIGETERDTDLPPRWMFSSVHAGRRTELLPHPHSRTSEILQHLKLSIQQRGLHTTLQNLLRYVKRGDFYPK